MIGIPDILKGEKLPDEFEINMGRLLHRLNMLEQFAQNDMPEYNFKITSGFRTMEKHKSIYAKKGITDESKIPMKSKHLTCCAADIFDPEQKLQAWCLKNESKLQEIGVWCEEFSYTPNWIHFQIYAPLSMKRFFKPW